MSFVPKCIECKRDAEKDKEKSDGMWIVYANECVHCGGEVKFS